MKALHANEALAGWSGGCFHFALMSSPEWKTSGNLGWFDVETLKTVKRAVLLFQIQYTTAPPPQPLRSFVFL